MTESLKGMLWGVVLVSNSGNGQWMLLEQSIRSNPMETIEITEALWGKPWAKSQRLGACLIRLNLDGDVPCDLMFSWGQGDGNPAYGIMDYDEEFEKLNTSIVFDFN